MIVCDTNLIAYLLIPGDQSSLAESVFRKESHWIAPLLWRSEMRNVLTISLRKKILTLQHAVQTMEKAEHLLTDNEYAVPSTLVLDCVQRRRISAYDAEFLVLAEQFKIPLVTTDRDLLREAPKAACSLQAFLRRT